MITLLREDFKYHQAAIMIVYTIGILMIFLDVAWGIVDIDIMMGTTTIAFFIGSFTMGITEDGEKRERLQALLPIPLKIFGVTRLLFMLIFQGGILGIWLIHMSLKYSHDSGRLLLNMLSNNSYNLFFVTLFLVYHDLGSLGTKVWRILYLFIAICAIAFLIYLSINEHIVFPMSYSSSMHRTVFEGVLYTLLCGGLLSFDYFIFLRRKTYLD